MKLSVKSKSDQVKDILREDILNSKYAFNKQIPIEPELCKIFGVSRITIREAVCSLVHEGLLKKIQGKGTFVTDGENSGAMQKPKIVAFLYAAEREQEIGDSYHFDVFRGASKSLNSMDYEVKIKEVFDADELDLSRNLSGLILSSTLSNKIINKISKMPIPSVLYAKGTDIPSLCTVLPDFAMGAAKSIDYLYSKGYKDIIFVDECIPENERSKIYLEGYLQGLKNNNIVLNKAYLWDFPDLSSQIQKLQDRINSNPDNKYAILIANDASCVDIINKLNLLNIKIPGEVAVMGFYNRVIGKYTTPPLTTIDFDKVELGKIAAKKLHKLIQGKKIDMKTTLPVEIVVREST